MHSNENFTTEINSTHFDLRSESKNHLVSFLSYLRFLYCFWKKGTIYVLLFSSMSSKSCLTVIGCRIYMYSFKFTKNTSMQLHCLLKWHSYYYVLVIFTRNFFNFHTGNGKQMNTVVYRKPKYSAETEYFYYSAFGFGRRNFILDIRPSVLS